MDIRPHHLIDIKPKSIKDTDPQKIYSNLLSVGKKVEVNINPSDPSACDMLLDQILKSATEFQTTAVITDMTICEILQNCKGFYQVLHEQNHIYHFGTIERDGNPIFIFVKQTFTDEEDDHQVCVFKPNGAKKSICTISINCEMRKE